ncbi:MAG TPA: copper-translocating P-type ATPase, partial [Candidatus Nanoarchaeia archaeon]|nr:copper-translocating P-type ATPase [Candidatus Nanoarchaeia archaeon]
VLLMFILMGKYLEARTKHSTGNAIRELMNLAPDKAVIVRKGKELTVNINEVIPGDILLVKPGQRVPVDGAITSGTSSVDESMITGESMPVLKKKDDEVIGGTINGRGVFYYKALRVGADTYLARIVKLVDNAQGSKAPIQKLADKVSGIFVPIVLLIALSSITTWLLLGSKLSFSLMTMISVLVIACPCALGLATPTAVIVGSGMGAKNGVLFKTSEKLEILSKVKIFVFDKTGTLTKGSPVVTHLSGDEKTIFYAASAERFSEHPLAKAIIDRAKNMKLSKPKNFKNYPGMGVKCTINGNNVLVGSEELMIKNKLKIPNEIITIANKAKTIVLVSVNKKIIGFLGINDPIKEGSKEAISELKNRGASVYMITGDNEITARAVANEVGITNVISKVKPEDKAKKVSELKKQGLTAFIGDGVNDAPALAVSDVGIAIGSGTDVAIETGDVILVKGDLRKVLSAVKLSSHTINKVKQNLFWAFFYNVIAIPAAFMGLLNPVIAGSAMAMSSVSVVTNSLLLKFKKI